jgi:hypothetical protein
VRTNLGRSYRGGFILFLLAVLMFLSAVFPYETLAKGSKGCRKDPMVWLSNGEQIQMAVMIEAAAEDVNDIRYTIHLPPGVTITRVVYMGNDRIAEQVVVGRTNMSANQYRTETLVTMKRGPAVRVTAQSAMRSVRREAIGQGGSAVVIDITPR